MSVTLELLPFGNPGYVVGLPLITIKSVFFFTLKNIINCQGKMIFCQGNVREMSGNFEPTQMWQPWTSLTEHYAMNHSVHASK